MRPSQPAKLLRIHLSEQDKYSEQPLYEAIVEKCRELRIAGATVFRGVEGYGDTAAIHRRRLLAHDQPIIVTIIDSEAKIRELLPILEDMIDVGLIAMSDVEAVRITKTVP